MIKTHLFIALLACLTSSCANNTPILFSQKADDQIAYGLDISKHQDKIVNDLNINDAISFVICKASDGTDYTDPNFRFNWRQIKKRQLIRGAYHFYRTNDDPLVQAKFFLKHLKGIDSQDLPPIVDIEKDDTKGAKKISEIQKDLLQHLNFIEQKIGRRPMIYTGPDFANEFLVNEKFAKYPLWIADYSKKNKPILPKTWEKIGQKFWQRSQSYSIESRISDFDIFNGTRKDLISGL